MTNEDFQKLVLEKFEKLDKLEHGQEKLEQGQDELRQGFARMENDHGEKLSALFDAREVQTDVNDRIVASLTRIESKLDKITLKVAAHDSALKRAK